jgi:uncharacterized protein YpmB
MMKLRRNMKSIDFRIILNVLFIAFAVVTATLYKLQVSPTHRSGEARD